MSKASRAPAATRRGLFFDLPELSGKQLGLLKEIVPGRSRIAISGIPGLNVAQFEAAQTAVESVGIEVKIIEVQVADDFERALEAARTKHVDAGIGSSKQIGEFAIAKRLPLISLFAVFPQSGGLISYGPNVG
jgi:putative ABC transport system substrate-binding protein